MIMFLNVKAQSQLNDKESARVFVQKFYNWYNKLYNNQLTNCKNCENADKFTVEHKPQYFEAKLLRAYIEYFNAEPKKADEIIGLDFDPILAAQDVGFDYQTGSVKKVNGRFFIDIHCGQVGKSRMEILKEPIVLNAEVINTDGVWKFANFTYPNPNGGNLLDMLKTSKKEAEKYVAAHKMTSHK